MIEDLLNQLCTTLTGAFDLVSVHSGNPGTTGANEIPDVTRQATTWPTADDGESTAVVTFPGFVGTAAYLGFWNAGQFVCSREFVATFDVAADLVIALNAYVMERQERAA